MASLALSVDTVMFAHTIIQEHAPLHRPQLVQNGWLTPSFVRWLARQSGAILLESARPDAANFRSYVFLRPVAVVQCHKLEQVQPCLQEIEYALQQGLHAAGFISYEAGYAFENFSQAGYADHPLLWFGLYENPIVYNCLGDVFESGGGQITTLNEALAVDESIPSSLEITSLEPNISKPEYLAAIDRIKNFIAEGDTYQVNFTFKLKFDFRGDPAELYCRMRQTQPVSYAGLLSCNDRVILSMSPELFFRLEGRRLTLKPMKGTAPRGRYLEEDRQQRSALASSDKNRAENLMIVDLLRNDAGRLAQTGSVEVSRFFEIEKYETLFQATSTIRASLSQHASVPEFFRALFPCGSITGAPKIRTMQLIQELERGSRGVYTGAIGFFSPKRKAVFNVAIRTVVLDPKTGKGELGIGSGVVYDSEASAEYEESLLKSRFLTEHTPEFQLIETLRWDAKRRWFLLGRHLRRMGRSAHYFGFKFDRKLVLDRLLEIEKELLRSATQQQVFRVRLTLDRFGNIDAHHARLDRLNGIQRVAVSHRRTNSADRFLFHKTTRRELYDRALNEAKARGLFDYVFLNERGEVTEGGRSNLIIRKGQRYFTPPLECGLLPGTYREHLLAKQKIPLSERVLCLEDLESADAIWVCNALHGMVPVRIRM